MFRLVSEPTLNEVFDSFMSERQHYKPSTIRSYRETWRYIRTTFGDLPCGAIDAHELAVYRSTLAGRYKPRTINRIFGLVRSVLNFAVDRGYSQSDPARSLKAVREETPDIDPFTLEEVDAVLASLRPIYRFYYAISLWTGARPCELQALRWQDVSFELREMSINKARVRGKEGTPKTKRSKRILPLFPPALAALSQQRSYTGSDIHNYVFVTRAGDPITKHMDSIWKNACRRAGVRHRPPYQLRHTFASLLLAAGEAPAYVAKLLGHTTTETLYRHYARWIPNANGADGARFLATLEL